MAEQIDILEHHASSVLILNAMAAASANTDFLEGFGLKPGEPVVSVTMQVNGVEVPVQEELERSWKLFEDKLDKLVEEKAVALLKDAGLWDLRQLIENAEWEIQQALKKAKLVE